MLTRHGEIMEVFGNRAEAISYSGAATSIGSGALVVFGHPVNQIEIAFASMVIGAIVGIGGLITTIFFKWLAHKETVRMNKIKLYELEDEEINLEPEIVKFNDDIN